MPRKRIVLFITAIVSLLALVSCSAPEAETIDFFAMDTYMVITVCGENAEAALSKAKWTVEWVEYNASVTRPESVAYMLNNGETVTDFGASLDLFRVAYDMREATDGAFNPMMYPIIETWGFYSQDYRVPAESEIDSRLPLTEGWMVYDDGGYRFPEEGMGIDFGGVAKGYAAGLAVEAIKNAGAESAILSLGGNVYALGTKPDGSMWNVAVQDPFDMSAYAGYLRISDLAAVTSGAYQRYFERDGKVYHHIFDPETGKPAESGLASVTVVGDNSAVCDALSTAFFVMGRGGAIDYWRENGGFELVLIDDGGAITITEGLTGVFESERMFEVVEK